VQSELVPQVTQPSAGSHFKGATHPKPPSVLQSGTDVAGASVSASLPPLEPSAGLDPSGVVVEPSPPPSIA
jgi:hypothetical protein